MDTIQGVFLCCLVSIRSQFWDLCFLSCILLSCPLLLSKTILFKSYYYIDSDDVVWTLQFWTVSMYSLYNMIDPLHGSPKVSLSYSKCEALNITNKRSSVSFITATNGSAQYLGAVGLSTRVQWLPLICDRIWKNVQSLHIWFC